MPFIGKTPETGAFRLIDSITTSATDTYALTVQGDHYFPESARNLIVSLNGVTQAPETAYTVSGSHIVFASALTASDVIDYILVIGDAVDIGTPSDGTVGNAQLKASLDLSGKTLTFTNDQISGNAVDGGTISNFASTGIDDNATSTAITIDSSQNVGVGTPSPADKVHVEGGNLRVGADDNSNHSARVILNSGGASGYEAAVDFKYEGNSESRAKIHVNSSLSGLIFSTIQSGSITEDMRLDGSGNLLVGKEALGTANEGMQVKAAGELAVTRANNHAFILNRKSSDGGIALFQKDGTTVGSIYSYNGFLGIGSTSGNDAYLLLGSDFVAPATSTGTARDGAIDLGSTGRRFKDLYLSGGAYLGGTGSANHLDDYEEGSWTPQVFYQNSTDQANATNTVQSGRYRKIGSLVYVTFRLDFSQGGSPVNDNIGVKNLPFAGSLNHYEGGGNVITSSSEVGLIFSLPNASSTVAVLVNSANVGNFGNEFGSGSNKYIRGSFTYITS